jgi:hypothetical protein
MQVCASQSNLARRAPAGAARAVFFFEGSALSSSSVPRGVRALFGSALQLATMGVRAPATLGVGAPVDAENRQRQSSTRKCSGRRELVLVYTNEFARKQCDPTRTGREETKSQRRPSRIHATRY